MCILEKAENAASRFPGDPMITPAFVRINWGFLPVHRILISADGQALSGDQARTHGIEKVCRVYVRKDGWTLGVPVDASPDILIAAHKWWDWECNPVNNCLGETLLKSFMLENTTLCVMRNGITERV